MNPQNQQTQLPQNSQPGPQPQEPAQVVYVTRPLDPEKPAISPEALERHEDSKKRYPSLNLSEGEYVISAVRRHPIGLVGIWFMTGFIILLVIGMVALLGGNLGSVSSGLGNSVSPATLALPTVLIGALIFLGGVVASWIYSANEFYLTNESVIQRIQTSLFHKREQTVSLVNIEDASYTQEGILPHLFNYGLIRLSTEGDETTYRFNYASNPNEQVAILNNAVEAFKMGRPVSHGEGPENS